MRRALLWAIAIVVLGALLPAVASAATINVTTATDEHNTNASFCSLREAINAAETNSTATATGCIQAGDTTTPDTIVLGGTNYPLTGAGDDTNAAGDLDFNDSSTGGLTIQGQGPAQTTITAPSGDRAIDTFSGSLTLQGLKVTGGAPSGGSGAGNGGGIRENAGASNSLAIQNASVTANNASGDGGGIFADNFSSLNVTNSQVSGNTAAGTGGGGGIEENGSFSMTGSTVDSNQATAANSNADGGGLGIQNGASTTASISNSTISGNSVTTSAEGGGIARTGIGNLSIDGSTISGNHANGSTGGGIQFTATGSTNTFTLTNSTVTGNTAMGAGAGIYFGDINSNLNVSSSSISSNSLAGPNGSLDTLAGAGLFTRGKASTITDSTIASNTATSPDGDDLSVGVGLDLNNNSSTATNLVKGTTISGNGAGTGMTSVRGAALSNDNPVAGSTSTLINDTIRGNQASNANAANYGGIEQFSGAMRLIQDTFSGNTGFVANEIYRSGAGAGLTARGTIIDDAATNACILGFGSGAPVSSLDYNIERGASCFTAPQANDLRNTDPQLGALAANGGTTQTMALPATSPAVDWVPTASCLDENGSPLAVDQRGQPRPAGPACDVGAYEFQPPAPETPPTPPSSSGSNTTCFGKKATLVGTGASEVLVGTAGNDVIAAMGGNDTVNAGGGNDIVCGGAGNDTIKGGPGNDILLGQGGRDRLFGGAGRDLLNAGAGKKELCNGGPGTDTALGCESKTKIP